MYSVDVILDEKQKCLGRNKVCGIYKITNKVNNKIYIGSSKNIHKRWKNHIKELITNKHANIYLQHDWNEYGKECFMFEILEKCSEDIRYSIEQEYLNKLLPFYRTGKGYNICEKSTERNETNIRFFNPKDLQNNYFIVKAKGCRPHLMDADHCNITTREELGWECFCLDVYSQIKNDIIEQCGVDDWEWG